MKFTKMSALASFLFFSLAGGAANSPKIEQGKFILMQADLEAAASLMKWQLVATAGRQEPTTFNPSGGTIFSRRHYVSYRPTDQLSFRAGRFQTAFGINTADHMIVTKRGLRFDEGSETYNLEGAWLGENFDAFITAVFGRPDAPQLNLDKGFAVRSGELSADQRKHCVRYEAVNELIFIRAFSLLELKEFGEHTFVDYGCGKGRALLLASKFGFKHLICDNLSRALSRVVSRSTHRNSGSLFRGGFGNRNARNSRTGA